MAILARFKRSHGELELSNSTLSHNLLFNFVPIDLYTIQRTKLKSLFYIQYLQQ